MTELIQNLLDISKYEMNAVHRHDEPFSIDDMLNSLVETFKLQAGEERAYTQIHKNESLRYREFIGSRGDVESSSKEYHIKFNQIHIER